MTLLTKENLIRTCEVAALAAPYRQIMRAVGAKSEGLIYHWRRASIAAQKENNRDCIWFFEWRTGQFSYWHEKIAQCKVDFYDGYSSDLAWECRFGREEAVLGPDQKEIWATDPELVRVSDEDLLNLYGRTDRYLLDPETGNPVPLTRTVFPPAPVRLRILEQLKQFRASSEIDVNMTGTIVHQALPPQRRADEPQPNIPELRKLALMAPDERLKELTSDSKQPSYAKPTK